MVIKEFLPNLQVSQIIHLSKKKYQNIAMTAPQS